MVPTDDITIYYEASGELQRICTELSDFIFDTVKQPMVSPFPTSGTHDAILTETAKVSVRATFRILRISLSSFRCCLVMCDSFDVV